MVVGYVIAATRKASPLLLDRRLSVSGSLISVISMKLIFFALYFEILSSSVTHVPGSVSEVLIRRRSALTLTKLSEAGEAAAKLNVVARAAIKNLRYILREILSPRKVHKWGGQSSVLGLNH